MSQNQKNVAQKRLSENKRSLATNINWLELSIRPQNTKWQLANVNKTHWKHIDYITENKFWIGKLNRTIINYFCGGFVAMLAGSCSHSYSKIDTLVAVNNSFSYFFSFLQKSLGKYRVPSEYEMWRPNNQYQIEEILFMKSVKKLPIWTEITLEFEFIELKWRFMRVHSLLLFTSIWMCKHRTCSFVQPYIVQQFHPIWWLIENVFQLNLWKLNIVRTNRWARWIWYGKTYKSNLCFDENMNSYLQNNYFIS